MAGSAQSRSACKRARLPEKSAQLGAKIHETLESASQRATRQRQRVRRTDQSSGSDTGTQTHSRNIPPARRPSHPGDILEPHGRLQFLDRKTVPNLDQNGHRKRVRAAGGSKIVPKSVPSFGAGKRSQNWDRCVEVVKKTGPFSGPKTGATFSGHL